MTQLNSMMQQPSMEYENISPRQQGNIKSSTIIINVDIGTQIIPLTLSQNDHPLMLAKKFCYQHNLDKNLVPILERKIKENQCLQTQQAYDQKIIKPILHQPAYKRLYKYGQEKQIQRRKIEQQKKKIIQRPRNCKTNNQVNYGVMMYQRGVRRREMQKKRNLEVALQKKNQERQKDCTHHPQINQLSKIMVDKIRSIGQSSYFEQAIQKRKLRNSQIMIENQKKQLKQCSFSPNLNKNSLQLAESRKFHHKYNKQSNCQQCTFTPKLNPLSEILVNGVNFKQRLKRYQQNRQQKYQNLYQHKLNQQLYDRNGQPFYYPKINQYSTSVKTSKYKTKTKRDHTVSNHQLPKRKNQIYQTKKRKALSSLFQQIDTDHDNYVNFHDFNNLTKETKKIAHPIIEEMMQMNIELDKQEFILAFQRLIKILTPTDKTTLLKVQKKKTHKSPVYSFRVIIYEQPSVNTKSKSLAQLVRPEHLSIYEYGKKKQQKKKRHAQNYKRKKQQSQISQCTFKPQLSKKISNPRKPKQ